jgi:hypothetical protein
VTQVLAIAPLHVDEGRLCMVRKFTQIRKVDDALIDADPSLILIIAIYGHIELRLNLMVLRS